MTSPLRIARNAAGRMARVVLRRAEPPRVLRQNARSVTTLIRSGRRSLVRKEFADTDLGREALRQELLADQLFRNAEWKVPITLDGDRVICRPFIPDKSRLDQAAQRLSSEQRFDIARQAMRILFDIFARGYAHRDFHATNLFFHKGKLLLVDFETLVEYPAGNRPAFPLSYDITGEGLPSPYRTDNMCFARHPTGRALSQVLQVPVESALKLLIDDLKQSLREASLTFQTHQQRHTCKAQLIYSSFALPHLQVKREEAQRDCARRIARFGITDEAIRGKSVLDLGSNIGGMIFELQRLGPRQSLGVEYDQNKVEISNRIAAFNGLNSVSFQCGDIDQLESSNLPGPFEIVLCLAIDQHVKDRDHLFRLLGSVGARTVYFEGNAGTDIESVKAKLSSSGFGRVEFLGLSDDDCVAANNVRPLFVAHR